jgi:mitochondrial inner membrane protease ATP23
VPFVLQKAPHCDQSPQSASRQSDTTHSITQTMTPSSTRDAPDAAPLGGGGGGAPTSAATTTDSAGPGPPPAAPCLLAPARAFWALWRVTEGRQGACGGAEEAGPAAAAAAAARAAPTSVAGGPCASSPSPSSRAAVVAASATEQQPANKKSSTSDLAEERYGTPTSHTSLTRTEVERLVDESLRDSTPVRYLLDSLARGGCGVGRPFFHVARCDGDVHGGFSTEFGVVLCHNRLQHPREVELALTHELVHAYDFCRARDLDLTDCRHHACTEVRAAALSGDCGFSQELLRGNLSESLVGQYRRCVRRRAAMSVAMNPHCQAPGQAEAAVAAVMPQCFRDTDPWPRIPALQG